MRLCGTGIGAGGCPQFPHSFLHASLSHREGSKVVIRGVIFGSDYGKTREMPPCADVIFF